jgi:iron complex transport system substrate-binding protein
MTKNIETPRFVLPGIEDITRRDFLVGGAAAILLGGCGSGGGENGREPSGGERTIEDEYAVSVLSGAPERVVTLFDSSDLDACLALGVDVLAFGSSPGSDRAELPWKQSGLEETGAELIPMGEGPNFERIAALEPDLILSSFNDENAMDRLRELCPVVYIDRLDWRGGLRRAGRALYKDDEAEAVIAETEQKISRAKDQLASRIPNSLVVVGYVDNGNVYVSNRRDTFAKLLEEVGFPPLREGEDEFGTDVVSREVLPELLTSDAVIFQDFGYEDEAQSTATEELMNDPLIANTPAIESGRVLRLTPEETAASFLISALSIPTVLEGLKRFPE